MANTRKTLDLIIINHLSNRKLIMSHLRFQYLTVLITQHHVAEIVKIKTQ